MQSDRRSGFERRIAQSVQVSQSREQRRSAERRFLLRDPDVTIGRLRLIPLLKDLTMPQYAKLLNVCAKRTLNRGDVLCRMGEPADVLFFLVSGMIRVTAQDGGEFTRSSPKEVIGKIGFFTGTPHTMTVVAESDCSILSMSRVELMHILSNDVELWVKILTNLVAQLAGQMKEKAEIIRSLNNANLLDIL